MSRPPLLVPKLRKKALERLERASRKTSKPSWPYAAIIEDTFKEK